MTGSQAIERYDGHPDAAPPAQASHVAIPAKGEITLSIVIPTLNEVGNVAEIVSRLDRALAGVRYEVIFVDDDSPDGTWSAAKALAAKDTRVRCVRRVGRRGLSGACIEGILSSSAPYVLVMDGDLQHDETIIPAMLGDLAGGADLVVASRYAEAGSGTALGQRRGAISQFATRLAQFFFATPVTDPMSGFFMMRRECFEAIAPKLSPIGFKILLDILISSGGSLAIAEQPYTFRRRFAGDSKFDAQVGLDFLGLLLAKATGDFVGPRFITFCLVGAVGLIVHLAVLRLSLVLLMFAFPVAQALATFVSMGSNFFINNAVTYRDCRLQGRFLISGFITFCLICSVGALANVGTASWLYTDHVTWWGAGVAGALMGAVWNYSLSTEIVWRRRS